MKNSSELICEMENASPSENQEYSNCEICKEKYAKPLIAINLSDNLKEKFYACPKCLSPVPTVDQKKLVEVERIIQEDDKEVKKKNLEIKNKSEVQETTTCPHKLGYLKKRPKDTAIPEECLTCSKIIECMSR